MTPLEFVNLWKKYLRLMREAQAGKHFTVYTPTFEGFMQWLESKTNK